ncbi:PucR family transcriptional regulator [Terrisporobacter mayombei]|uniref:PucR C-terminal helix-turn-helix domain-containing protein n=1 Tax=Terrisporobacter mayombei TaxID=1541 RepID=A0ABY9PZH5_9FIRM|nr:helix-turn-helix domain-containing protein [Terrisporobacter mayombei]MCC3868617.1 helix-turn-helix domain-containing protein [Terrisporobacter mayombei]WMT80774.1 hypothetical protein TEMA_10960 [Terrisporobacter mayombei]
MITIKKIADKLCDYDINTSIIKDCELIDFRYLSKRISNFNPYSLYIFKASNLPNEIICQEKINFLIIKDKPLPSFLLEETTKEKYNYIILNNKELPIYKLIYIVQDIFNLNTSLISFQEDILNAIFNSKSIDDIIKISFNYLKNPIILLNSMYHTCSYYYGEIVIDDPSWNYQLKMSIPHPIYSLLYNQNTKNRKMGENKEEIITTFFPEVMKYKEMTIPIVHDNFTIARISVLECNNALNDRDFEILKTLGKLIYPLLLFDKRFLVEDNTEFDNIMNYLLKTTNPNKVLLKNSLSTLNIDNSNNKYLLILRDNDNVNSKTKINYVKQYIASLFSKHIVFVYKNSIIVIYNNKNSYKKFCESDEYEDFIKSIKDYTLKVGVSKLFNSSESFKIAYDQCEKAICFGELINKKEDSPYYFDDYVIFNIILSFLEKRDLNNLLDSKLKDLILSNSNDLYYTLYSYIQCRGDTKLTSEKLNIHYNTLKYRLNKIENLFNMDLGDEDYLVKLKLSFNALDMKKLGGAINVHHYE